MFDQMPYPEITCRYVDVQQNKSVEIMDEKTDDSEDEQAEVETQAEEQAEDESDS